jgi:hypothetical protein
VPFVSPSLAQVALETSPGQIQRTTCRLKSGPSVTDSSQTSYYYHAGLRREVHPAPDNVVSPDGNGAATIWLQRSTAPRRPTRLAAQSCIVSASAPTLIRLCDSGNHLLLVPAAVELIAAAALSTPGGARRCPARRAVLGRSVMAGQPPCQRRAEVHQCLRFARGHPGIANTCSLSAERQQPQQLEVGKLRS